MATFSDQAIGNIIERHIGKGESMRSIANGMGVSFTQVRYSIQKHYYGRVQLRKGEVRILDITVKRWD